MNDELLDAELKALFEAEHISVDATSEPVDDFLEAVIEQPSANLPAVVAPSGSEPVVVDSFAASAEPVSTGGRPLLLVAVFVFVALIGAGVWVASQNDDSPVLSDEIRGEHDVNDGAEIVPTGFIEGPLQPQFIIDERPDLEGRTQCLLFFDVDFGGAGGPLDEGHAAVSFANGATGGLANSVEWVIEDEITTVRCSIDEVGGVGIGAGSTLDVERSSGPTIGNSYSALDDPGPWRYTGRFTSPDDVLDLQVPALGPGEQSLVRFDDFFVLEFVPPEDQRVEIHLADGSVIQTDLAALRGRGDEDLRCYETACAGQAFEDLQDEADAAGATRQAAFIASGVLSQAEYDAASVDFENCLAESGESIGDEIAVIDASTPQAGAIVACYESEIAFVESARHVQNGLIDMSEPNFDGEEEAMNTELSVDAGLTVGEIVGQLVDDLPTYDSDNFGEALAGHSVESRFLPSNRAALAQLDGFRTAYEGLLAPGTYEVEPGTSELELLQMMASEMEEQFDTALAEAGDELPSIEGPNARELSEYEVLIVASLIEAEATVDEDRPRIARVIYNRLRDGWPLAIDSTTLYAVNKPVDQITVDDLNSDSPFNTRALDSVGLPPTPIGAPSLDSIRAALSPADGDWRFYVRTDEGGIEGALTFAATEEQFEEAKRICRERSLGC